MTAVPILNIPKTVFILKYSLKFNKIEMTSQTFLLIFKGYYNISVSEAI